MRHKGASLLETVVVMGIVGTLLAIALPLLARARDSASLTRDLSNLRTHAAALQAYGTDYDDQVPTFSARPAAEVTVEHPLKTFAAPYFFAVARYWAIPMIAYYEQRWPHSSQLDRVGREVIYELSASAYARPEFWRDTTRVGPEQWRYGRSSEVAHPARKASFAGVADLYGLGERSPRMLGLFDGSALVLDLSQLNAPYPTGEGHWPGVYHRFGRHGQHTIDGVQGIDVARR